MFKPNEKITVTQPFLPPLPEVTGEVITTPFSFVATSHALWWNNIRPVFVDIEPDFCTLDPEKVESAISPKTTGGMPVHVYGHPYKTDRLQEIADIYGLHLIYDAAHAFGVKLSGRSLANFGDLSLRSCIINTFISIQILNLYVKP